MNDIFVIFRVFKINISIYVYFSVFVLDSETRIRYDTLQKTEDGQLQRNNVDGVRYHGTGTVINGAE